MLTIDQKDEIYRFLCKNINYGTHPINDVAQLFANNHISSKDYGYSRLKNMLRDMPEFMSLVNPKKESDEMQVRFSIWQRQKTASKSKNKTVLPGKTRRAARGTSLSKPTPTSHHHPSSNLPEPPESLLAHSQLDSHMLELLALKTGRVQASLPGLLESSYQQAKAANSLDYTKDKIGFRLYVLAKNGKPIFVTFKRAAKKGKHQAPYTGCMP